MADQNTAASTLTDDERKAIAQMPYEEARDKLIEAVQAQMEETIEFLHSLPPMAGSRGVHAPGEGLDRTRAKNRENGIPVTEETWARILQAEKENVQKTAPKF